MNYRVLYLLQSPKLIILEIKRLNLPDTAPADQVYQWLHYLPATEQLTPLTFVAMHSAPPFEERQFAQGSLRFSSIEGTFQPVGTSQVLTLHRDFLLEVPPTLVHQLA